MQGREEVRHAEFIALDDPDMPTLVERLRLLLNMAWTWLRIAPNQSYSVAWSLMSRATSWILAISLKSEWPGCMPQRTLVDHGARYSRNPPALCVEH